MTLSRRAFIQGAFACVGGIMVPSKLLAVSHDMMDAPEFIPSHPLDFSPVSTSPQPAKTQDLKRITLNAMIDPKRGRVIGDVDKRLLVHPMDPASLSKIVTFMVVQDFLRIGKNVKGEHLSLKTKIANVTLLNGAFLRNDDLIVQDGLNYIMGPSNNQICTSLAITVADSEVAFVELMNAKARELGMSNTRFINASGLPGDERKEGIAGNGAYSNLSTLEDMCKLTVQVMRRYPEYRYYSKPEYDLSDESNMTRKARGQEPRERFASTHPLYKKAYREQAKAFNVNGLKTGTTDILGRGLIVTGELNGYSLAGITAGHPVWREERKDKKRPEMALKMLSQGYDLQVREAQELQKYYKSLTDNVFIPKPNV